MQTRRKTYSQFLTEAGQQEVKTMANGFYSRYKRTGQRPMNPLDMEKPSTIYQAAYNLYQDMLDGLTDAPVVPGARI